MVKELLNIVTKIKFMARNLVKTEHSTLCQPQINKKFDNRITLDVLIRVVQIA